MTVLQKYISNRINDFHGLAHEILIFVHLLECEIEPGPQHIVGLPHINCSLGFPIHYTAGAKGSRPKHFITFSQSDKTQQINIYMQERQNYVLKCHMNKKTVKAK